MIKKILKYKSLILYVYTVILLGINSLRIFNDSIWGDEGFSIRLASREMSYLIERTARDVHPPLYYIILKFFYSVLEPNAMVGKFVSFLAIVLVCIVAVTYFRKKFGTSVAMIIVGVVTFTGNCVPMIVEIRMYTWGLFFIFMNLVCMNEILENETGKSVLWYWGLHCVFSLLAAYTHYYALITVAIMDATLYVSLFVRNRSTWKKSVISMIIMVLGYLPWLSILLEQFGGVSQNYWIQSIDLEAYILYLFGDNRWGKMLLLVFFISVCCFYFVKDGFDITIRKSGKENICRIGWSFGFNGKGNERILVLICVLATFGTIFVGTVLSVLVRPLYNARYIFPALGLMAVALAISFTRTFRNRFLIVCLILLMAVSGSSQFWRVYREEATYLTEETKQYMGKHLQEGDGIVTDNALLDWTVLEYYFPENERYHSEEIASFDDITHQRLWLMLENDEALLQECEDAGFTVEFCEELGLDNIFFSLYLLER